MASSTSAERHAAPSWRFVVSHPAHAIALLAGIGRIPRAPGTFGTLAAWPVHAWAASTLEPYPHLLAIAAAFALGIWAAGRTSHDLGVHDHGAIVFDELVAFWLVLFFTPPVLLWQALAFTLFRLLDIVKPPPIGYFDRTVRGGLGVMFDDLVAAGCCLLVLALLKTLIE